MFGVFRSILSIDVGAVCLPMVSFLTCLDGIITRQPVSNSEATPSELNAPATRAQQQGQDAAQLRTMDKPKPTRSVLPPD
jgi:hypothetical protein